MKNPRYFIDTKEIPQLCIDYPFSQSIDLEQYNQQQDTVLFVNIIENSRKYIKIEVLLKDEDSIIGFLTPFQFSCLHIRNNNMILFDGRFNIKRSV